MKKNKVIELPLPKYYRPTSTGYEEIDLYRHNDMNLVGAHKRAKKSTSRTKRKSSTVWELVLLVAVPFVVGAVSSGLFCSFIYFWSK